MEKQKGFKLRDCLWGAVIGASIALIVAPKKGRDLREDLWNEYERLKIKGSDFSRIFDGSSANITIGTFKQDK